MIRNALNGLTKRYIEAENQTKYPSKTLLVFLGFFIRYNFCASQKFVGRKFAQKCSTTNHSITNCCITNYLQYIKLYNNKLQQNKLGTLYELHRTLFNNSIFQSLLYRCPDGYLFSNSILRCKKEEDITCVNKIESRNIFTLQLTEDMLDSFFAEWTVQIHFRSICSAVKLYEEIRD